MKKARACEICNEAAVMYCDSDSAFLCWNCDARVHGANFLVARHLRRSLCVKCKGFGENCISGVVIRPFTQVCQSCSPKFLEDDTDSASSACVSSTESFVTYPKKVDFARRKTERMSSSVVTVITDEDSGPVRFFGETRKKSRAQTIAKTKSRLRAPTKVNDGETEGILVKWCRMMRQNGNLIVRVASRALGVCLSELTMVLPFRVALTASLWFGLRLCGDRVVSTCQNLKRLEEISGVPARMIVAAEARLARVLRDRKIRHDILEEGWAESECSV